MSTWGRPELYTSYAQDMALFNTRAKWVGVLLILLLAVTLPFNVNDDILRIAGTGLVLAVGAIGLNLVTGYAGQVSLGHAFFVGVGAYSAAVMSGDPDGRSLGRFFLRLWALPLVASRAPKDLLFRAKRLSLAAKCSRRDEPECP